MLFLGEYYDRAGFNVLSKSFLKQCFYKALVAHLNYTDERLPCCFVCEQYFIIVLRSV